MKFRAPERFSLLEQLVVAPPPRLLLLLPLSRIFGSFIDLIASDPYNKNVACLSRLFRSPLSQNLPWPPYCHFPGVVGPLVADPFS